MENVKLVAGLRRLNFPVRVRRSVRGFDHEQGGLAK
jgi:hypothetical protein